MFAAVSPDENTDMEGPRIKGKFKFRAIGLCCDRTERSSGPLLSVIRIIGQQWSPGRGSGGRLASADCKRLAEAAAKVTQVIDCCPQLERFLKCPLMGGQVGCWILVLVTFIAQGEEISSSVVAGFMDNVSEKILHHLPRCNSLGAYKQLLSSSFLTRRQMEATNCVSKMWYQSLK